MGRNKTRKENGSGEGQGQGQWVRVRKNCGFRYFTRLDLVFLFS
ncbi:hypothetical protein BVRB_8g199020 [Beta vulgaris subsp. vulgaris]|nr:hypothetical protein BVRB_8g199020 [Beta vulgaris subsp. vulgaris]